MARQNYVSTGQFASDSIYGGQVGYRDFGDGVAGRIIAARLQAYSPSSLAYQDVLLDATGAVQTAGGGAGGGGAVTVADGADVAQGGTADVAWVGSGSGSLVAVGKAEYAKLEAIRALVAATLTADVSDRAARLLGHVTVDSLPNVTVGADAAGLAKDATLTGGTQKAVARGGAKGTTAAADVTSTASGVNHQPLDVAVYDGAGNLKDPTQIRALASGTDAVTVVQGAAGAFRWLVDASGVAVPVTDNGGSITVDAPVATPVFVRLSDGTVALAGQKLMAASLPVVLASDQSALPENLAQVGGAAIAAKPLPTNGQGQTAIPVWDQAIQLATYDVGPGILSTGLLTAATRKDILSIEHAALSTKTVKIRRITLGWLSTTAVAGDVEFSIYEGAAASSAGTVLTPNPTRQGTAAAEAVAKSFPTIVAATRVYTYLAGSVPATANSTITSVVVYDWKADGEMVPLTLRAGFLESIVLAVQSIAGLTLTPFLAVEFTEE